MMCHLIHTSIYDLKLDRTSEIVFYKATRNPHIRGKCLNVLYCNCKRKAHTPLKNSYVRKKQPRSMLNDFNFTSHIISFRIIFCFIPDRNKSEETVYVK